MRVGDVAKHEVVTVGPDISILEAARVMREQHVGTVVVVDRQAIGRVPIGILTDRDIVVGVVAQDVRDLSKIKVADVMAKEVLRVRADDEIFSAMWEMRHAGVRRLPVVNDLEVLVGIISYDDLVGVISQQMRQLAELFPEQRRKECLRRA